MIFPVSGVRPSEFPPLVPACLVMEAGIGWKTFVAERLPWIPVRFEKISLRMSFALARMVALFANEAMAKRYL